jgi:hypothetical protein
MRLILFGAGASYGSEHVSPYCPPLGKDLFDKLAENYPDSWGRLPPGISRSKFVPNFELGMKDLWDYPWHGTAILMRCMADYFSRFRALEGNTYARLLEHLESRGALEGTYFSTLNYECVPEYAARRYGFEKIDYFAEEPTTGRKITVWKIHGSCNFLPQDPSMLASTVSLNPSLVIWDGNINVVDPSQVAPFVASSALYPAMAVFMEGKPIHGNPTPVRQLQSWWREAVLNAETIGMIGVNPNPADTHIWQPLAGTRARLAVIGNQEAYQNWVGESRRSGPTEIVGGRFAADLDKFGEIFSR